MMFSLKDMDGMSKEMERAWRRVLCDKHRKNISAVMSLSISIASSKQYSFNRSNNVLLFNCVLCYLVYKSSYLR